MKAGVLSRLKRLEEARDVVRQRTIEVQIGHLKILPHEYKGERHILHELWISYGLPKDFEGAVTLCLEEILSNVILHGCLPGRDCKITAHFRILNGPQGGIEIEVSDNAKEFDPLSLSLPDLTAPLEHRNASGLGVFLVRTMMDEVCYKHQDGRNHLVFGKGWDLRRVPRFL